MCAGGRWAAKGCGRVQTRVFAASLAFMGSNQRLSGRVVLFARLLATVDAVVDPHAALAVVWVEHRLLAAELIWEKQAIVRLRQPNARRTPVSSNVIFGTI